MADSNAGVGVNGEPDDFSARYDRMLTGGTTGWIVKVLLTGIVLLTGLIVLGRLLGL